MQHFNVYWFPGNSSTDRQVTDILCTKLTIKSLKIKKKKKKTNPQKTHTYTGEHSLDSPDLHLST